MKEQEPKKLKPIVFVQSDSDFYRENFFKQNLLLKALTITTDPHKLKKMAHLRTVADVYRTLDKLALRKEYHEALSRKGISFDYLVQGFKDIIENGKDREKLGALQSLLKSVGMDIYRETEESGEKDWEQLLLAAAEKEMKDGGKNLETIDGEYEVIQPVVPEEERRRIEEEGKMSEGLYE